MIDDLNDKFGSPNITFSAGKGGLPKVNIENDLANAEIYLHGSHITGYQPAGAEPVLWMSDIAVFNPPKPIRGGVPVCWPWFGGHATDPDKSQHGFARNQQWSVRHAAVGDHGATTLVLGLTDNAETREIWPHRFDLEFAFTISSSLGMTLRARNTGNEAMEVATALHTYFNIGNIEAISISGLDQREFHDQLDGMQIKRQSGDIRFGEEVDRIYINTADTCTIDDPSMSRRIAVAKKNSESTVIWNPWIAKATRMADYPNEGYKTMVCIETTNAAGDIRTLAPGEEHAITQIVSLA